MKEMLLLLGGNVGEPTVILPGAETLIEERIGKVLSRSRDHWSEPWGFDDPRPFLNRSIIVGTSLGAHDVMRKCLEIERHLGRIRRPGQPLGPRPIDIDILLIGKEVIDSVDLVVPHPRMHLRKFALAPAADVAPDQIHPVMGETVLFMLDRVQRPIPS